MEIISSKSLNLLLPKELLKSIQDIEDEYLGSFLSTKTIEEEKQNKDPKSTAVDLSQKELLAERKKITRVLSKPCLCGKNCQNKFTVSEIIDACEDFRRMSWTEQHSFIVGKLQSFMKESSESKSARRNKLRERQRFDYRINADRPVCRNFFLLYYGESIDRLKRRQKYLIETGIIPPAHGNTGKKPKHACSKKDRETVLRFISNFTAIHGLPDPGRDLRSGKGRLNIYLPTVMNYMAVHRIYKKSMEASKGRVVEYHTFRRLWVDNFPNIIFSKTKSDLCMTCEEHKKLINISVASGNEEEKIESLEQAKKHLIAAQKERNHYRHSIEISKQSYDASINSNKKTKPDKMHYSWDFSQQIHYPYEDHQVGPIYFKTPRIAHLFGVCCEALPRQANYLIDEADLTNKGADTVISLLHHYFEFYGLGEKHLLLTADNCIGQNKNNAVLHYLLHRTMKGLHKKIELSFMLVGHTKFAPDAYFGLLKKKYRRLKVYTYKQIVEVINSSTEGNYNVCHSYRNVAGSISFKYRKWSIWLNKYFHKLPGISQYHHFAMNADNPGVVIAKQSVDSKAESFDLLKTDKSRSALISKSNAPLEQKPEGLSQEREWYLYDHIREHIPDLADKNLTAPLPEVERPVKK